MNRALIFLWYTLAVRRGLQFLRGLRRPTSLIGFGALVFFLGACFHYRRNEVFGQLVRTESLIGCALILFCGSVFKGFLQRGLVFELPDVEFLFTGPFTQRQIVFYRLLPNYFFALVQGLVFLALFAPHLSGPAGSSWMRPAVTALCVTLFQVFCFHVASGAAIFAGTISEQAHHRVRWILLGIYAWITLLYLRAAWDVKLIPARLTSSLAQALFYPAVTLPDLAGAPRVRQWAWRWSHEGSFALPGFFEYALYAGLFAVAAMLSLWALLRLRANIFEASLATSARVTERRRRLEEGRGVVTLEGTPMVSARLPRLKLFRGAGALIWKNLVVASRSRHQLVTAAAFAFIYIGLLVALRWVLYHEMAKGGELPENQLRDFDNAIAGLLLFLGFLLQRTFPYDFRRDGRHLVQFRTLPMGPYGLVLAEIAVPIALCLAFQAVGILALLSFGHLDWRFLLFVVLAFPAIALGLNSVWNLHYLLAATKRAGGKIVSASPVAAVMVVVLSFLVFYPAGWLAVEVGQHVKDPLSVPLGFATGLGVQYAVDFLLIFILARLFESFEVARDS